MTITEAANGNNEIINKTNDNAGDLLDIQSEEDLEKTSTNDLILDANEIEMDASSLIVLDDDEGINFDAEVDGSYDYYRTEELEEETPRADVSSLGQAKPETFLAKERVKSDTSMYKLFEGEAVADDYSALNSYPATANYNLTAIESPTDVFGIEEESNEAPALKASSFSTLLGKLYTSE